MNSYNGRLKCKSQKIAYVAHSTLIFLSKLGTKNMTFHIKFEAQSDSFGEKLKHKSIYFSHFFRETNYRFFCFGTLWIFRLQKAKLSQT